eukprot:scaffold1734_cov113-Isochrysis_galbana.AAC.26
MGGAVVLNIRCVRRAGGWARPQNDAMEVGLCEERCAQNTRQIVRTSGHILAAVVADALDNGERARVAHAEALPGFSAEKGRAGGGAVACDIADDDIVLRREAVSHKLRARVDDDLAAGEAFAAAVVGVALHLEFDALGQREAEGLPGVAAHEHVDGAIRQPHAAVALGDLIGEHGANGAVEVVERLLERDARAGGERIGCLLDELVVEDRVEARRVLGEVVELGRLVREGVRVDTEHICPPDHLGHRAKAHLGHVAPHLLSEQEEEIDHVLGLACELGAELGILCRDADGASRNERRGGEAELLGSEERGDGDVLARFELPVGLQNDARAQPVEHEGLVRLGEAELPGQPGVLDARPRGGAGAAIAPRDDDVVRLGLGDAGGDDADANLGDELDRDARGAVGRLEVVDQLRQVLDGVDVVVRRGRDEADAGSGAARLGDELGHLVPGQLAALTRLGALRHLDLDLVRIGQVLGGDAEAAGGDLLDGGPPVVLEAQRVLTALARVGLAAE